MWSQRAFIFHCVENMQQELSNLCKLSVDRWSISSMVWSKLWFDNRYISIELFYYQTLFMCNIYDVLAWITLAWKIHSMNCKQLLVHGYRICLFLRVLWGENLIGGVYIKFSENLVFRNCNCGFINIS